MGQCAFVYECCPKGFKLSYEVYEDENLASSKQYLCVKDEELKLEKNLNQTFDFNVIKSDKHKIPHCSDPKFLFHEKLENMMVLYSDSCVDVLENEFHVFSCEEPEANESVNIYKMHKCCPVDFSYDIFERKCVKNSDDPQANNFSYISQKSAIVFNIGVPECSVENVLVEYHSAVHHLLFHKNLILSVLTPGEHMEILNKFCIENSFSHDEEPIVATMSPIYSKEAIINSRKASKWIVKACQEKAVCDHMPCIRKCCKEGERFVLTDDGKRCDPHPHGLFPTFHFFHDKEVDEISFKPAEPPGESELF